MEEGKVQMIGFRNLSKTLRGDKEIVLAAVRQDGWALQYASLELRGDRDIVFAAVKQNGRALANAFLRGDRDIVLTAVKQDGCALLFASLDLQGDRDIVLAAVRSRGRAIYHASCELRGDQEVMLTAVQQEGGALLFASIADRESLFAAIRRIDWYLPTLREDPYDFHESFYTRNEINLRRAGFVQKVKEWVIRADQRLKWLPVSKILLKSDDLARTVTSFL